MNEPGTKKREAWTTAEIRAALRRKYAAPAWALLEEVADSTGYAASRSCDAIAVSCWRSAGALDVVGIEIKASRADWLREIKDPDKGETFRKYCDRWYVAAGAGEIVKLEELPEGWGLMTPAGDDLRIRCESYRNASPEPISRGFLAALARRMTEQSVERAMLDRAFMRGREEGYRAAVTADDEVKHAIRSLRRIRESHQREAEHITAILRGADKLEVEG